MAPNGHYFCQINFYSPSDQLRHQILTRSFDSNQGKFEDDLGLSVKYIYEDLVTIKAGQTFGDLINDYDIPDSEKFRISQLLSEKIDLTQLNIGTEIRITFLKKNNFIDKLFKKKKDSLNKGLKLSSESFFSKISKAIVGKSKVDDKVLDELEEILISSDVGVKTTLKIIDRIENRVAKDKYISTDELDLILKEEIISIISDDEESVNNLIINKNNNF